MSRGLGRVQLAILEKLKSGPAFTSDVTWSLYQPRDEDGRPIDDFKWQPSQAQHVAVRRAIGKLKAIGLVGCIGAYSSHRLGRCQFKWCLQPDVEGELQKRRNIISEVFLKIGEKRAALAAAGQ